MSERPELTSNAPSSFIASNSPKPPQNHAVIILASGLSQRLGQAKQLLRKNGESLTGFMLKLALSTKPQAVIVVIPDNHSAIATVLAELTLQHPALQTVVNPVPKTGMAHSLRLGIDAVTDLRDHSITHILIMGVDQVLLDTSHLMQLLAGKQAVVASGYHSYHDDLELDQTAANEIPMADIIGLPLVIDVKLLTSWQASLIGDKGLRDLIRGLPSTQVETVVNPRLSYDIDTPRQLTYAKLRGWLDE